MIPDGAIDIHVHAEPSLWERRHDAEELAQLVSESDQKGVVIKSHFGNSFGAAQFGRQAAPDVDVFSSLTLNTFVGGFNPSAVKLAIETGVSVVWLPTFSAEQFGTTRHYPFSGQNLTATESGEVRPEIREIIDLLDTADHTITLGNGHLSPTDTFAILDEIESMGADIPYLITHADSTFMHLSIEDQVALADRGAVIEKCYIAVTSDYITLEKMAGSIPQIGPEQCVLSTDHGQPSNDSPPEAYATFIEELRANGLSDGDLQTMASDNPQRMMGGTR